MNRLNLLLAVGGAVCIFAAADGLAQSPKCKIKRDPFVNNGTATGTMTTEQGAPCEFKFRFQNIAAPDSWKLVTAPKSGNVAFKEDVAEYRPNEGFTGEDQFVLEIFGRAPNCSHQCNRNGRFEFSVTVRPTS